MTFLLTSLLWWAVFTYMAYNRDELSLAEEIESVEEQSVSEYREPQPSDVVVEKSEKVAEKQPVKKAAPATSAKSAPAKEAVSAPKQESVAKNLTSGQSVSQPQSAEAVAPSLDISQEIIGKWKPVQLKDLVLVTLFNRANDMGFSWHELETSQPGKVDQILKKLQKELESYANRGLEYMQNKYNTEKLRFEDPNVFMLLLKEIVDKK